MFDALRHNHYGVIAADPPWHWKSRSETRQTRSAGQHYDLMSLDEIKAMPVADLAAPNCALLLWTINPMLPQALEVMSAWGFTFKTIGFCWAKTTKRTDHSWAPKYHMGLGYWTRANVEICLLGSRGKPKRIAKDVRQLLVSPVRAHSRKPEEFYSEVERFLPGPHLELFSRTNRKNWSTWGAEAGKFNAATDDLAFTQPAARKPEVLLTP